MISRKQALKRFFGIFLMGFVMLGLAKHAFADFVLDWVGNEMMIFRDNGDVVVGTRVGDIVVGGGATEIDIIPEQNAKANIGNSTFQMNNGFFDGTVQTDALRIDDGVINSVSSGTGTVKMNSASSANSTGWFEINMNGTVKKIPFWDDEAP